MHPSVRDAWHSFSTPLEGRVHSLYCDVKGLITTAVGNLVDPISLAEQLPWTLADGSRASLDQVRADWHKLKDGAQYYSRLHWRFAADATKVRLTDTAIDALVASKLIEFEAYMKKHHFHDWDSFPADGQLGILSMSWACGPGFPATFSNFTRAVNAGKWASVALKDADGNYACKIRETANPGVVPRNRGNCLCFINAQIVKTRGMDPSVLHWPGSAKEDTPLPTIPPNAAINAVADLKVAANRALGMTDVVGRSGENLRQFESDEAPDSEPPDVA